MTLSIFKRLIIFLILIPFLACESFVQIDPPKTGLIRESVFSSDATATAAVLGIYSDMYDGFLGTTASSITIFNGLSADELIPPSSIDQNYQQFFQNNILPSNTVVSTSWGNGYNLIYQANAIIEGLSSALNITPTVKLQLEGEAKFIRAYCHFYLVNLFGDIPFITSTDYRVNNVASRIPTQEVYKRIVDDLVDAKLKLADNYDYSQGERVRPNKWVVTAFLARVFLYADKWTEAESEASEIIGQNQMYSLTTLDNAFLKNNPEAIWQFKPSLEGENAGEANSFILRSAPTIASLNDELVNAFEAGDLRRDEWIGTFTDGANVWHYARKYKIIGNTGTSVEYSTIFRLAEQYLIRAEARAQQNKMDEAISDIDMIRDRAKLSLLSVERPTMSKEDLILAIEKERRVELFTEHAHRWFDLKRYHHADAVLGSNKIGWESEDVLLPIPESELLVNSNLKPQNPGY